MSFFNQIKKGVQTVTDKSDELVESTKIKMAISKIESQITQRKMELGALTYRLHTEAQVHIPEITSVCTGIDACYKEITDLQNQLVAIQPNPITCPSCSGKNAPGAMFCSGCGTSLQTSNQNGSICPSCSAPNRLEAKFCVKCGTVLLASPAAEEAAASID
ncbi:MAG: zinc ribbon domain-containing protein [Syntrophomonas sp.]